MSEILNQQEKTNTASNQNTTAPEARREESNLLKHPEQVLNKVFAALSTQSLWIILIVPLSTYLSFFIIILSTFFLFKPPNTSIQKTNQANQSLTEGQRKLIAEEIRKVITSQQEASNKKSSQQKTLSENPNSILAKGYIDGQIKEEQQNQAEKMVKDEIDKLKADWKGDLFGQISFPVIFAIASIFAAFAVKDILTEILKHQERERIKEELRNELTNEAKNEIIPKAINHLLHEREAYTYWLEHQLLNVEINQIILEIKQLPSPYSKDLEERNKYILDKAIERLQLSLNLIADQFQIEDFKAFKSTRNQALEVKIRSMRLSKEVEQELLGKLNKNLQSSERQKHYSQPMLEKLDARIDNLVDVELGLLIATLSKPQEDEVPSEIEYREEWLNSLFAYLKRDKRRESQARVERLNEHRPNLAPLPPLSKE